MAGVDFNEIHREYGIEALRNHIDQQGRVVQEQSGTLATAGVARHPRRSPGRERDLDWWCEHDQAKQYLNAVVSALVGIVPANELEAMIGAQVLAEHAAVMECHRRATLEGRPAWLSQAAKLSRVFSAFVVSETLIAVEGTLLRKRPGITRNLVSH
ncbi:MAG: hypothetical protein AAGI03_15305 [Pseudomonadota bacterium]